jgi:hypothetical protein
VKRHADALDRTCVEFVANLGEVFELAHTARVGEAAIEAKGIRAIVIDLMFPEAETASACGGL